MIRNMRSFRFLEKRDEEGCLRLDYASGDVDMNMKMMAAHLYVFSCEA